MKTLEELTQEYLQDLRILQCEYPPEDDIMNTWEREDVDVDDLTLEDVL